MTRLFRDDIEPCDEPYRVIRDDPDEADAKVFVERLWGFFSPYADHNFRGKIATSFSQHFWEMYLAFGLAMQGANLQPISSGGQSRRDRLGPDLQLLGLPHPVWVEAIVPFRGGGPDQVPEMRLGTVQDIPSEALILRYRHAIEEKFRKLLFYLKKGVVKDSDPYVIAINSRSLPFGIYEPPTPRILQALFPLGDLFVTFDPVAKRVVESGHQHRAQIEKKKGNPVSTTVFLDPIYEGISAVLFCPSNVWNRPPNDAEVGLDFMFIHNPLAKNKIPHQWLKCGRECWMEDDHLVIKNWYKELTNSENESEKALSVEDIFQDLKSQRRVKYGDVPREEPSR